MFTRCRSVLGAMYQYFSADSLLLLINKSNISPFPLDDFVTVPIAHPSALLYEPCLGNFPCGRRGQFHGRSMVGLRALLPPPLKYASASFVSGIISVITY